MINPVLVKIIPIPHHYLRHIYTYEVDIMNSLKHEPIRIIIWMLVSLHYVDVTALAI